MSYPEKNQRKERNGCDADQFRQLRTANEWRVVIADVLVGEEQADEPSRGDRESRRSEVELALLGHLPESDQHE